MTTTLDHDDVFVHTPDCDGDDAPWCSPACVAANCPPLPATLAECAADLGRSPETIRRQCRDLRLHLDERGRRHYDLHRVRERFVGVPTRRRKAS